MAEIVLIASHNTYYHKYRYGKHRNWTFVNGSRNDHGICNSFNKYAPEEVIVKKQVTTQPVAAGQSGNIPGKTTAAIVAAVSMVTGGQGKVTKIEKL